MSGADDPILDAKTISAFVAALDAAYGLDLPVTVPSGGLLAQLWAAAIAVAKDPEPGVLYAATGTGAIPAAPLPPVTVVMSLNTTNTHQPQEEGTP